MKNLHKKIGAMVLAGMVVLGGVAASGVNSFAASSKISIKNPQEQKVRNIIRNYGILLEVSSDEKDINNIKKEKYNNMRWNRKSINVKSHCEIPLKLIDAKKGKYKILKVKFQNMYYLIEVKY